VVAKGNGSAVVPSHSDAVATEHEQEGNSCGTGE
jgi:hypothetical protein